MTQWPPLDATQQNELLGQISLSVVNALSPGWREVILDYRVVGKNIDVAVVNRPGLVGDSRFSKGDCQSWVHHGSSTRRLVRER